MKTNNWQELYEIAKSTLNPRRISPFIEVGGVASAILTEDGNIYTGICIETACSLGMCAERNAIANMITKGEHKIEKLVCVFWDGRLGLPCGACREYLMQLHKNASEMEILTDLEAMTSVKLKELVPNWWGTENMMNDVIP